MRQIVLTPPSMTSVLWGDYAILSASDGEGKSNYISVLFLC